MNLAIASPTFSPALGQPVVSSLKIADHFGKRHKDVLRSITQIRHNLPESFDGRNFALVDYTDSKGETRAAYDLTRDGFMVVVMGYTGKAAMLIKVGFINAFNAMEAKLRGDDRNAATSPFILPDQHHFLTRMLQSKVNGFPEAQRPKLYAQAWMRFKNKFRIGKIEQLPATKFEDAMQYLTMQELKLPALAAPTVPAIAAQPRSLPTVRELLEIQSTLLCALLREQTGRNLEIMAKAYKDIAYLTYDAMTLGAH